MHCLSSSGDRVNRWACFQKLDHLDRWKRGWRTWKGSWITDESSLNNLTRHSEDFTPYLTINYFTLTYHNLCCIMNLYIPWFMLSNSNYPYFTLPYFIIFYPMPQIYFIIVQIIESKLKIKLPQDINEGLQDGVILCHLANHLRPRSIMCIHIPSPAVVRRPFSACSSCKVFMHSNLESMLLPVTVSFLLFLLFARQCLLYIYVNPIYAYIHNYARAYTGPAILKSSGFSCILRPKCQLCVKAKCIIAHSHYLLTIVLNHDS